MNVHVLVGIILNVKNEVLIELRPEGKASAHLWGFPGGKRHANETPFQALKRELQEEINIEVRHAEAWLQIHETNLFLDIWRVLDYEGELRGAEGQIIRWVPIEGLSELPMLGPNHQIVERLRELL